MHTGPASPTLPGVVAISGATGFIGAALTARLRGRGVRVRPLVRRARACEADDILWDPMRGVLPAGALDDVDAVIHLAGEPIAQRWTAERKQAIRESRVLGTALLARAIAESDRRPATLLSGSAVGFYGDRGDELLDEGSSSGTDYLAGVGREWEGATAPARDAGVRVVLLRTGLVLAPDGGVLERLLPPFRLGVGGPIGSGRQWMSWISRTDHLRAVEHALGCETLSGPVNFVGPNPVTNAEFAVTLGRVLTRPALVPVPAFALRLMYGEMADATILAGQRVLPTALVASGFEFSRPTLEQALRAELA
jgi:hypothetical protein